MKTVKGDLLELAKEGTFDVIVHGCNCFCAMGAGIAKSIKTQFPDAFRADCATGKGDRSKLGTITAANVGTFVIVNGYTQYHWGGDGILVDYAAVRNVFREIKKNYSGRRIGYPKIGAGLAKGDWKILSSIINEELKGEDHTLVEYQRPNKGGRQTTLVGLLNSRKRARQDDGKNHLKTPQPADSELIAWIRSKGGFVHPAVYFQKDHRELRVSEKLNAGERLMKLPQDGVVVNRPFLPESYQLLKPVLVEYDADHADDVLLAVYLANDPDEIRPYMESLPDATSLNALPIRWSSEDKESLLRGSPLLDDINDLEKQYSSHFDHAVSAIHRADALNEVIPVPSKKAFQTALSFVDSRAFGLDGLADSNETLVPAMVPLLDLCNHYRGSEAERKNVSYVFREGFVEVTTARNIGKDEALKITYGARSNAHLLLKYGFCLKKNLEPDGSSNDVLKFFPKKGAGAVTLQTGPKSYTYGKFVKALEHFYPEENDLIRASESIEGDDHGGEDDDIQAFLSGGGTEEEFDIYEVQGQVAAVENNDERSPESELEALRGFKERLLYVSKEYALNRDSLQKVLAVRSQEPKYNAALLIRSELRTVQFYVDAISKVEKKLLGATQKAHPDPIVCLDDEDAHLLEEQVAELVNAYLKIRHPSLPPREV